MGRGPAAGRRQGLASRRTPRWRITGPVISAAVLAAASGCSVGVPDPAAPRDVQTTPALATPTITPGHDAEAVAAKDLPFTAGDSLAPGIAVGLSDGLREAPGWKPVKENVAGENRYLKTDGCVVSARVRVNQGSLAVSGDDRASTVELFKYVDSRILPGSLKTDTLRWGGEPDKPGPKAEVLVFEGVGGPGGNSTAVLARLFGKAGSSIYISVSCPDPAALATARTDVAERLIVVPPTN
ncbi:hypothetical protein [Arthrobacter sp. ISL-72]|uniref:hypothetical protein n=1 Tax=Arthrobacter sp. ISL-72 TaxID=2819114 RepID=UPI00203500C5|nr:hypothetical protein [Arthrobacter sp. ISL-72]